MDVMVDLETLSTRPHALILVIGAVKFNRKRKMPDLKKMDTFYRRITISSCIEKGMHIVIEGSVGVYTPRGEYQFYVVQPSG